MLFFSKDKMEAFLKEFASEPLCRPKNFPDATLNLYAQFCRLLEDREGEIRSTEHVPLATILLSRYYWTAQLSRMHRILYGPNAGLEQQNFKVIEEMDQRLDPPCWWDAVKQIDKMLEDNR